MRVTKRILGVIVAAALAVTATALPVAAEEPAGEAAFDLAVVNFDAQLSGADAQQVNTDKILDYSQQAKEAGDEIVLFPEYALTSNVDDAVTVEDSSVQAISDYADQSDLYILFGAVVEEAGDIYSGMVICDPDGNIDVYEKTHLSDEEYSQGFSAGTDPYVLSTPYGKFGIALGDEFADVAELGKYYYGAACRMILVGQSYQAEDSLALSQAEYDLYTATYAYLRMYSRYVAVANLYTEDYFGESHICTGYQNGWIAGGNDTMSAPAATTQPGIQSGSIAASNRVTASGMSSRKLNLLADWYGNLVDYDMPVYGAGSQYQDEVRVASVNFHPQWGDLEANVANIEAIMAQAAEEGVQLLVFPEMALTGYSVVDPADYSPAEQEKFGNQYMQHVLAQTVRGENPSEVIVELQQLAQSYDMYVLIGMPERDEVDPETYWNSVAILGPDLIQSYRKVNLASPEPVWASYGTDNDGIFETPFGYVGVAICADIYNYQELQRTYSEMGARIVVNCTAGAANSTTVEDGGWQLSYQNRLESFMLRDDNFMITSNLVGYDGPELSAELTDTLAANGYTVDDITSSWLYSGNTQLYSLIDGQLNDRACIFPGASVCIALDPESSTGTTVYGNTGESSKLIPYAEQLGPYVDVDGDGYNPYLSYTTDTFDTFYTADFDLSLATLSAFTNDNPMDYRPDLYYKWYSDLFYETFEGNTAENTLTDAATGISVSGDLAVGTQLNVNVTPATTTAPEGYTLKAGNTYSLSLTPVTLTTPVIHTSSMNALYGATNVDYTGAYNPYYGTLTISLPVEQADLVMVYAGNTPVPVVNGAAVLETSMLEDLTVLTYQAVEEPGTDTPSTDTPSTDVPDTDVTTPVDTEGTTPAGTETVTTTGTETTTPIEDAAPVQTGDVAQPWVAVGCTTASLFALACLSGGWLAWKKRKG